MKRINVVIHYPFVPHYLVSVFNCIGKCFGGSVEIWSSDSSGDALRFLRRKTSVFFRRVFFSFRLSGVNIFQYIPFLKISISVLVSLLVAPFSAFLISLGLYFKYGVRMMVDDLYVSMSLARFDLFLIGVFVLVSGSNMRCYTV